MQVNIYNASDSSSLGEIQLRLSKTGNNYYLTRCASETPFSATLPAEQDKIWNISKTDTYLKIECNGVEVLHFVFSDSTNPQCVPNWSQRVAKIMFSGADKASDGYRQAGSGSIL